MKEYFCRVNQDIYGMKLVIFLGMKDGEDTYILRNNEMEKIEGFDPQEPTLKFSEILLDDEPGFLRALVDGLIAYGVKPTRPIEDATQLKAVKYHLEDMRKIVFEEK